MWRWIDSGPNDGATQMATDRAVLECAQEIGKPTFRVYRWNPFCISLGYHQSQEAINADRCLEDRIDVVRRPTGGRAVFHAEEVTYSVVFPKEHPLCRSPVGEAYRFISEGLAEGIRLLGVPANLQKRALDMRAHYTTPSSVSCFSAAARHEIMVDGKKLVGSAQRRLPWGLLQHGSILVGTAHQRLPEYLTGLRPEEAEELRKTMSDRTISIHECMNSRVNYQDILVSIKEGLRKTLSASFEDAHLTELEQERIPGLRSQFSVLQTDGVTEAQKVSV